MQAVPKRVGRARLSDVSLALADGCGDGVSGGKRANAISNKKEQERQSDAREIQVDLTPQRVLEPDDEKIESKIKGDKLEKEERDENCDDDGKEENEDEEIFTANEEVEHGDGRGNKEESAKEDYDGDECLLEYRRRGGSSTSAGEDEDDEATDEACGSGGGYQSVASEHSDEEECRDAPLETAPADSCRPDGLVAPPSADATVFNALLTTPPQQPQQQPPLVTTPTLTEQQQQQPPRPPQIGYPTVCVSPGGLITLLLKYDVSVEMTLDRTLRVVNHRHKAVAASNARGSANCLFHVAAKVFQDGTRTEAEVFGERRCRMTTDGTLFASGGECYLLDGDHIVPATYCFSDMSRDCSVNILLAAAAAAVSTPQSHAATAVADGPSAVSANAASIVVQCEQAAKSARYYFHKNGSTTVILNNVKVHQDERGDVQVTSGPKYICTSPVSGYMLLRSHFVDMSAHANWFVSVRRGEHLLRASYTGFAVSNGRHEAGFDPYRAVFSRPFCEVTTSPAPCAGEINVGLPLIVLPQPPPPLVLLPTKLPPPQPPPPPTITVAAQPQASATSLTTGIRKIPNRTRFDRYRKQTIAAPVATTGGSTKAESTAKSKGKGKSFG